MHASFTRLLECAARATARSGPERRVTRAHDLARWLDVSPQVITNWKKRGVARDAALKAETLVGKPCAAWILSDGAPPDWITRQRAEEGKPPRPRGAETPLLSLVKQPDHVPRVRWEEIVTTELPYRFEVVMPDESMAPWLQAGDAVRFRRDAAPAPGDVVLVVDAQGRAYVRHYRPRSSSAWIARPANSNFADLDSAADGLRVLGLFCGMDRAFRDS